MFNTAPIMEWHNTTLLRYFMDICTFIISPKFFWIVDLLKIGAVYWGFWWDFVITGEDKKDL